MAGLAYQRAVDLDPILGPPEVVPVAPSLKRAVQSAIDWETVTPLGEIPRSSLSNRVKRGLRWWQLQRMRASS
jgi:hypothetical protein